MIKIKTVTFRKELDQATFLVHEFVAWLKHLYPDQTELLDSYFATVEVEMEALSEQGGKLLIAFYNGELAGTIGIKKFDDRSCEMKRLFVLPKFHGKGIGKSLATSIIQEAKALSYKTMYLETGVDQESALKLYRSFGFEEIAPYYPMTEEMADVGVFMRLDL